MLTVLYASRITPGYVFSRATRPSSADSPTGRWASSTRAATRSVRSLPGYHRSVGAPLVSAELVHDAVMAQALLDAYASRLTP